MREAAPLLSLGMQMALTMALFVGGGFWLDRWLGTSPLLTIGGAVLGVVSLFVYLFRLVGSIDKKRKKRDSDDLPER